MKGYFRDNQGITVYVIGVAKSCDTSFSEFVVYKVSGKTQLLVMSLDDFNIKYTKL